MPTTGVIVGKFYPPHRGHNYLIETAARQVDHLTVIVCFKPEDSIPGWLRGAWLREEHPGIEVLVINDQLPADDTLAWAHYTVELLGSVPDVAFTSEAYGESFAKAMGCRHVLVDLERRTVPISGTLVRSRPLAHWEFLAPPLRAYFALRVCVLGAESSGTTTLAQALAEHYHTAWMPEYGREWCEIKMARGNFDHWTSDEFTHIAREQSRREDVAAREANRVLICDTNAFATVLWHRRYMGTPAPAVEAIAAGRRYDLYLLTDVDIPFVQDGLRDGEHIRRDMHGWFVEALAAQSVPWAVVSGSHEERMRVAVGLVDKVLWEA